jgi:hypothetical protein
MTNTPPPNHESPLRTTAEQDATATIARTFAESAVPLDVKLANFPKYVRRQNMTRLLALYELFKLAVPVKGSIVECGVNQGFGLMSWANFSAVIEPANLTRRIYGFDTFEGFPNVSANDTGTVGAPESGQLRADVYDELQTLIGAYDDNRYLGHLPKVELVKGDATETIPTFIAAHPHLVVSLLYLDFDLYEPTKAAIEAFFPRMPKGAVIAFDELDNPRWPGETMALLETIGISNLELRRFDWDPYIGYAVVS